MDENHQNRIESKLTATDNKLWVPPLSPKDQNKLKYLQKKSLAERMGFAGKTPWDLIQLLLIPLVLAGIGFWFSAQQNQTSLQVSERQHQADLQIAATRYANDQQLAADQQRETILKTYLDDMSTLLLSNKLLESKPGGVVRQVARERTLTTLRRLDAKRNQILVQFLQDTHLIGMENTVIDLNNVDLSNDDLRFVPLYDTNLGNTNLRQADLRQTFLADANLDSADLRQADLRGVILAGADLSSALLAGADLRGAELLSAHLNDAHLSGADPIFSYLDGVYPRSADLRGADLRDADLTGADLRGTNLSSAHLSGTNLSNTHLNDANLSIADLSGADLSSADLSGANLSGAIVTQAQLNEAESLQGTIMPDGSKHP